MLTRVNRLFVNLRYVNLFHGKLNDSQKSLAVAANSLIAAVTIIYSELAAIDNFSYSC